MKRLIGIVFVLILLLTKSGYTQNRQLTQAVSNSEKRIALVIGNSAYVNAPPLKNPVNDAHDMAQALRTLGFDVIYRENVNQNDMKRAIREFGTKIKNGGIGLFYYAGHGIAVKGVNYLVPVDAKVEKEEEIEYEAIDAGFVLAQMDSAGNGLNIVVLDACRNNPFARSSRSGSRGLAQMDAPSGTLIAYATSPGSVASDGNARNGLYTQELLKFVRTPNLGLEEVFKQVRISVRNLTQGQQTPWEASSLTGDFYFAGSIGVKKILNESEPLRVEPASPKTADSDPIVGTYIGEKNDGSYVEFKSDGTVFVSEVYSGRAYQVSGKYDLEGNQITLKLDNGLATRGIREADSINFDGRGVYVCGDAAKVVPPKVVKEIVIRTAHFSKSPSERVVPSQLRISGNGWDGGSDIKVIVNGQDISHLIESQVRSNITLKGTAKDLNIRDGKNEVVVVVKGIASDAYEFKQALR